MSDSRQRTTIDITEECLSGTWAGITQGDLAPEMISSTKLSTVSDGKNDGEGE